MRFVPLTIALLGCADAAAEHVPEPAPTESVAVTTAPILVMPVSRPVHGVGRLRAADQASLSFPFGGIVADLRVVRGQRVRAGEVLAVLDGAAARAQLTAARSGLEKAERDAARAEALQGSSVSEAQRQDAQTGLQIARANVDAAAFQARRSTLVAPSDGLVVEVLADEDQTVGAGQPLVAFAADGGLEVELVLPAADALLAGPGTPATVTVAAAEATLAGTVTERSGGAGPLGGFTVVVALEGGGELASGLVATVDLVPAPRPYPTVPIEALAEADGTEAAVYVVEDGVARRRPVTIAFLADPLVALREAPPAGTPVVVQGVPFVQDGVAVVESR